MFAVFAKAQVTDSALPLKRDSATVILRPAITDSLKIDSSSVKKDSVVTITSSTKPFDKRTIWRSNLFFNLLGKGENKVEEFARRERKDWLFYLIIGLLFFLAIIRLSYLKYFNNLFRLFFKTTLRQSQVKDQLVQSQLSNLFFNLFFFVGAGIYLFLLVRYYDVTITINKWEELGTCIALVAVLYMAKFVVLKASGWVFGIKPAVETYTFIVFLVNKVLGVMLVPFIILLAFAANGINKVALTLSLLLITGMFIYRFIRSYLPIQNEIKVSRFHFFLYLCAFEITPLLLIYKVLLKYF
ncbi:MAG: DUF4271 domain-containing protein [Sphingobacteriales bacterium]|nr:DUF4271 domain-containing protein [Sphingobacteriales bacterium]MBI3720166.1 DUF4271 domain-containing protein [Sphingobacteriales bacterium]